MPQPQLPTTQGMPAYTEPVIEGQAGSFARSWYKWFSILNQLATQMKENFPNIIVSVVNSSVYMLEGATISAPENRDYPIFTNSPFAGTVVSTYSHAAAGTATATFKKNGVALAGGSHSVSTTKQTITQNVDFAAGDDLTITLSSVSSDADMFELRANILQRFSRLQFAP